MECDSFVKNGLRSSKAIARGSRFGLEFRAGGASKLRLELAAGLPGARVLSLPPTGARRSAMVPAHAPAQRPQHSQHAPLSDDPFMNAMDEISYWIYTKRAPCLMDYDNVAHQGEQAHCSKPKPKSVPSVAEVPSPRKKKKIKLSLLDEDSISEKQQNIYFDTSQNKKQNVMSSCKSDTLGSDIDFNIKNSSVRVKQKRSKLQKTRTTLHRKNKVVTSTPKVSQLRRSLRQAQQSLNNNSQLNSSFEVFNHSITNGHNDRNSVIEQKSPDKPKKSTVEQGVGDQTNDNKKNTTVNKLKLEVLNGQFEDLSDVSGFTANYIRSTKLQSTKTPRKMRCKNSRNLVKASRQSIQKDSTTVCANKAVNTVPKPSAIDCSTESENIINLVTTKSTEKSTKVTKSTSLLKFMDSKTGKESSKVDGTKTRAKANLNVSFESKSTSRYPKRYRNNSTNQETEEHSEDQADKRRKLCKNSSDFNNSDRKENPEATTVSRTRSGRNIGLTLRQPENSVLVLSNSTEQISSMVSMNVASPGGETRDRKKKRITRHLRSKKTNDKIGSVQRDSLRDKSGFTACFTDSDDDSEPLKQRKFFCA